MEKENEKKFTSLIIILLMVIILGLICYIGYDKMIMENDRRDEPKPSVTESPSPDDTPDITESPSPEPPVIEEEITDQDLIFSIYNVVYTDGANCGNPGIQNYYKKDKVTIEDLTMGEKERIVVHHVLKETPVGKNDFGIPTYSKEQILNVAKRLLGETTSFEIVNSHGCFRFGLESDGTYSIGIECGGEMCSNSVETKILKARKKDAIVTIDVAVAFNKSELQDDGKYILYLYADREKTKLVDKIVYKDDLDYISHRNVDITAIQDQVSMFRWTYKESNGGYAFVQMERIK